MDGHFSIVLKFINSFHIISQKMNICSKKITTVNTKLSGNIGKGLKRSKSAQHLLPKKSSKKTLERAGTEENFYSSSLNKSKSTKSLKAKSKCKTKSDNNSKKPKPKKHLDTKTVKKNNQLSLLDGNSIITQLDDSSNKNLLKEYFIYCNNKIPIENSAQRRLVYKIQMIDLQNKTTMDNFIKTNCQSVESGTQTAELRQIAVGQKEECFNREIQTQPEKIQKEKFQQSVERCFVEVLTDLQFLYLPNDSNFEPFTENERGHYGELLEALAKKMLGGHKNVVVNSLSDDQITVLLYQREGIQVGALEFIPLEGFPTHLMSILAYLKNLFCFAEYTHRQEILANLKMFYGLNSYERVKRVSKRLPHIKDSRPVLSDQIFQAFEYEMFKDYDFTSEITKQALHSHNKAVFDAVNAQLQTFRPFYTSEGEPFPWTNNLGMTHYDITEEALFVIFIQVKQKIQKQVTTLCGMHIDFDDQHLPKPHFSPCYTKKMQAKQKKMLAQQAKNYDDRVELDYVASALKFEVVEEILQSLMSQFQLQFLQLQGEVEGINDFQYCN